ncbi:putative multiple sugar transport system permease protein [Butyrivibrio fibrisolvens]|jgi:putative multiple sugar transport system permease protein|uniref:Xylose transport system permease protein XylH n=1 Tax=Butyrivibrio fibrisolvens TaxID=831 RepID=A0A1H9R415_BUTFI|nr:sugar ABC transporter permease [Butyrivibrio fibrisolvens]SER67472.1 putative multiple sugar transport system permease protein [Butyrivibrio fibrisolvens]
MKTGVVSSFFQKYTMILALIVVVIFFAFTTDGKILYAQNINNLISQNAYVFVLATGMLMCILTGGNIDLAVGSVVCFAGGVGAVMLKSGLNVWIAVLAMLVIGLLIGYFQGFWIAWISVPPFIATLAGMYAFRGLSNVVLNGYAVAINDKVFLNVFGGGADCYVPDFFKVESVSLNVTCLIAGAIVALIYLATTISAVIKEKKLSIASENPAIKLVKAVVICIIIMVFAYILASYKGIPSGLVWIAAVMLIYNYILNNTAIGRYLYAVGGNEKATALSGVNTKLVYFIAYANMGFLAGLAGILTVARASSAQPTYGQGYEMDAIAACFIGGASAYGGTGKISGVFIGAALLGVINQGMSIMGVDSNYQRVVKGIVLLLAVMFDIMSKREKQ